jgi:hypothetical protein
MKMVFRIKGDYICKCATPVDCKPPFLDKFGHILKPKNALDKKQADIWAEEACSSPLFYVKNPAVSAVGFFIA